MSKILFYPHPALTTPCDPVTEFGELTQELSEKLIKALADNGGLGLAAPQIGILGQIFVCQIGQTDIMTFINPEVEKISDQELMVQEGCLSLPGVNGRVKRVDRIHVKAKDVFGMEFQLSLINQDAVAFQHEFDHIQGITLFERMDRVQRLAKKPAYLKRYKKWKKHQRRKK